MIQPLRAWHRRIALLLAVLLPILLFAGIRARHPLLKVKPNRSASAATAANATARNGAVR